VSGLLLFLWFGEVWSMLLYWKEVVVMNVVGGVFFLPVFFWL
jgi:hypothetical protein